MSYSAIFKETIVFVPNKLISLYTDIFPLQNAMLPMSWCDAWHACSQL